MIIPIIFGLLVWLAVPLLFKGQLKKNRYKALAMACKIIGIAIILWTLLNQVLATA